MKTLLAIVNDPVDSGNFTEYCIFMANDLNMNLDLIYIQNPALFNFGTDAATSTPGPVQSYNEIDIASLEIDKENSLKLISGKIDDFRKELSPNVSVRAISEMGTPDNVINQMVSENKADMIIIESKNDNQSWLFDSSNSNLVINAGCPGWLVPSDIKYRPYRKIVYATDYNDSDINAIRDVVRLTGSFSPEILALHIIKSDGFKEETMGTGFENIVKEKTGYGKIAFDTLIDKDDKEPGESINEFAIDRDADLIILLKENKNFLERVFKSGSTRKVLKRVNLPVLIYHE
jgi:nucleotide-binding universal stress UspA family protein